MANETSKSLVLVSKQNGIVVIPAETPLTRLNYFDGKFLRASDLKAEQDYLRQLVQLSNQADGSGVAHGFDVRLGGGDTIDIGPGLAIDAEGRVLLMPHGTTISLQDLIDKSLDLQTIYGKPEIQKNDSFETCEQTTATPPDNITHPNNLYVIVISAAEALCGEEDVYGKLCEEACSTTTDRPLAVEGLIVRAVPLVLRTPLPNPKSVTITTQTHYRSRVASAYFEDERNRLAHLISGQGLKQQTWCLGADGSGNGGVAIAVFARAGSTPIFLDPWIVRRELIDTPARRYWQWRMMMRPWDVFLAQVLQFQCQLHELYQNFPDPGVGIDPCGGARDALKEAATAISELKQFYEKTSQQFTYLNVDMSKAITLPGGWTALDSLKNKLENVGQGLALLPPDQWLINGGIIELPSAGYLPVVPHGNVTVNDQVQRMMGKGVDLRFCVVRPDYVAHALEEAQHMERISLVEGLDDPRRKPQVDILVPDGTIVEEKKVVPSGSYEAEIDLFPHPEVVGNVSSFGMETDKDTTVRIIGAAHGENWPDGRRTVYLALELDQKQLPGVNLSENLLSKGNAATRGNLEVDFGLWLVIKCNADPAKLKIGQTFRVEADAIAGLSVVIPGAPEMSGSVEALFRADVLVGNVTTVAGKLIAKCRVTASGRFITQFTNSKDIKNGRVAFDAEIGLGKLGGGPEGSTEIIVHLSDQRASIRVSITWGKQPKEIEAIVYLTLTKFRETGPVNTEHKIMRARFLSNPEVLKDTNHNHIKAVKGLQVIESATDDPGFAAEKSALIFPPLLETPANLTVRGPWDWVLFHRRRAKVCSSVVSEPPPAVGSSRYQVALLPMTEVQFRRPGVLEFLRTAISERDPTAPLSSDTIKKFTEVEFGRDVATLKTDVPMLKQLWNQAKLGHRLVYAAMLSRPVAAGVDKNVAQAKLLNLENALGLTFFGGSAPSDVLTNLPADFGDPADDGWIFLIVLMDSPVYPDSSSGGAIGGIF